MIAEAEEHQGQNIQESEENAKEELDKSIQPEHVMLNVSREDLRLEIPMTHVRPESPNRPDTPQEHVRPETPTRPATPQVNVTPATPKVPDFSKSIAAQDILKCDFCQEDDAAGEMYCKTCALHLCTACVSRHIESLTSTCFHDIARYKSSRDFIRPVCDFHSDQKCEIFCKECDVPFCSQCLSEGSHKNHDITGICGTYAVLKDKILKDTNYLKENMIPEFEKNVHQMNQWIEETTEQYDQVARTMSQIGNIWREQLEAAIAHHKNKIQASRTKDVQILTKCEESLTEPLAKIREIINKNKQIVSSLDFKQLFEYRSSVENFRRVPHITEINAPSFEQHTSLLNQMVELIGKLGHSKITNIPGYVIRIHMENPTLLTTFQSKYKKGIRRLRCVSKGNAWICGFYDRWLKSFDLNGTTRHRILLKHAPICFSTNNRGDIIFLDDHSANIVQDGENECLFRVTDWKLRSVCCTVHDELLIGMTNFQKTEGKVVRYSGLKIVGEIQRDSEGNLLFCMPYFVQENRNLDICVTEVKLQKILVTDKMGSLRFTYSGNPAAKNTFKPLDIATDSKSQILIVDKSNRCVHIIDKDGQFIRIIGGFDLEEPISISVSLEDNLWVGESKSGIVKVIQYMKE